MIACDTKNSPGQPYSLSSDIIDAEGRQVKRPDGSNVHP